MGPCLRAEIEYSLTLWFPGRRVWFSELCLCYNTSTGVTGWTCISGDLQTRVTAIGQASTWPCFQLSALLVFLCAENEQHSAWAAVDWRVFVVVVVLLFFLDILSHPPPNICGVATFEKSRFIWFIRIFSCFKNKPAYLCRTCTNKQVLHKLF